MIKMCCLALIATSMHAVAQDDTAESPFHLADLNQDGIVSGTDLAIMLGQWSAAPNLCPPFPTGDLNEDCDVNGGDLAIMLGAWGETTGIPTDPIAPPILPPGVWSRPFPPPTPLGCNVSVAGFEIDVTTQLYGQLMFHPSDQPFYGDGPLNMLAIIEERASGFDITYIVTNSTSTPLPLPTLWVPGFKLEDSIEALTLAFGTTFEQVTWDGSAPAITEQNKYPDIRYAPVAVAKDSRMAVGLALSYPVLDYKHSVSVEFRRYTSMEDSWAAFVGLDGSINPGESRYYRLTARFSHPEDWIHTLEPYRDYLWSLYGNMAQYAQDLYPTRGWANADSGLLDETENPRGFMTWWSQGQPNRVDLDGWEVSVDYMLEFLESSGVQKLMVWQPSGLYLESMWTPLPQYPSLIMTLWPQPMLNTQDEFLRIADAGIELGFWWGNSATVAHEWNPPFIELLDITNPLHISAALQEPALARTRGAHCMSLDSYRKLPLWDAVPWLQTLKAKHPDMKWMAEPQCADILHMMMPFCTDYINVPFAPQLADYLVPGREVIVILTDGMATVENCWHYIGWGCAVLWYAGDGTITMADLLPAIEAAQDGWVGDPYAPYPSPPSP